MPAGALYARYVPPKPASRPAKPEVTIVTEPSANKQPASPSHKRKRDDKSERKPKREGSDYAPGKISIAEENDVTSEAVKHESQGQGSADATTATAGVSQPPKPSKRSKRQKTSATKDSGAAETADATEDDDQAKRHAGVFAKFQKSLNASGEPIEQVDDTEMLDDAEQPTLHGENDCLTLHRFLLTLNQILCQSQCQRSGQHLKPFLTLQHYHHGSLNLFAYRWKQMLL